MSDTYSEGTISIATGSHSVIGTDTYFKSIGLVKAGSMLTLDGNKYYLITDVVDDRHLTIEHTINGTPFEEGSVGGASYTVVKNFARQTNTGLASDFIAFQNELLQNKFEFFNWINATTDRHTVTDTQGGSKSILTPKGLDALIADLADGVVEVSELAASWSYITDKPDTATQWPNFTQVTGTLDESQLPEVAVKTPQLKDLEGAEGRRGVSQSPANFNHEHGGHNHTHHDLLEKTASELPPLYAPIKAPSLHFDLTQKRLHAQFSSTDVTDTLEINNYRDRRYFYVVNQPMYIQLRTPYTGRLSYRVYKWSAPDTAIPGIDSAPVGAWETVIVDVVDFEQFGTDGSGNYFYGIVDWISLEDIGVFVKLDKNYFLYDVGLGNSNAYIPTLGSITRNTGTLGNPFVECFLRPDYIWESNDLTPSVPASISPEWTQNSERVYSCSNVSDGDADLEIFPSYEMEYKSVSWGVLVKQLDGFLATTISNNQDFHMLDVGTGIFEGTAERIGFKRAYSTLTTKVEILFIRQTIVDPDSYGL